MNPETPEIRERILQVLRTSDRPLTTSELCNRFGMYKKQEPCNTAMHGVQNRTCYFIRCNGHCDTFLLHLNWGQRGLRELVRFEKLGVVVGHRERGRRQISWVYSDPDKLDEVKMLEELFAL